VLGVLSDGKMLLKLALLSLVESVRNDPNKYSPLFHQNVSSPTTDYVANIIDPICMNKNHTCRTTTMVRDLELC
jgi:hypothetical protein